MRIAEGESWDEVLERELERELEALRVCRRDRIDVFLVVWCAGAAASFLPC